MTPNLKAYPSSYEDSGMPWLGEVPQHWRVRSLGSLTTAKGGRGRPDLPLLSVVREKGVILRSSMADDENHNVIPEDLSNYKIARKGDLVINKMKAWQGSLGLAPIDGIVSPAYYVYNFRLEDKEFGQALLRSRPYVSMFAQVSDGVRIGQWDLSIDGMKRIPVVVPPPNEQSLIVRFLRDSEHRIRRYIRAKQQLIKLLEEQKQATIHQAVTRGLDPSVRRKPSGVEWLGEVPEHWTVRKLRHCGRIEGGMTPSMEVRRFWDGDIPWVTPKDMKVIAIGDSSIRVTNDAIEGTSLQKIEAGAVLLVVRGMILARRVPIAWTTATVTINQDMKAIIPRVGVEAQFLAYSLNSAQLAFEALIDESGHGTRRLPSERLRELSIALPPWEEQGAVNRFVEKSTQKLDVSIDRVKREIGLVREYRTRLIADVVTGKLDVREAAANLADEVEEPDESLADEVLEDGIDAGLASEELVEEEAVS